MAHTTDLIDLTDGAAAGRAGDWSAPRTRTARWTPGLLHRLLTDAERSLATLPAAAQDGDRRDGLDALLHRLDHAARASAAEAGLRLGGDVSWPEVVGRLHERGVVAPAAAPVAAAIASAEAALRTRPQRYSLMAERRVQRLAGALLAHLSEARSGLQAVC